MGRKIQLQYEHILCRVGSVDDSFKMMKYIMQSIVRVYRLIKFLKGINASPSISPISRKLEWLVMKQINPYYLFRKKISCEIKPFGFFEVVMSRFKIPFFI